MGDKSYDVIVIGGGINGLTAGAYLAKAGAKVLITERRWETGGAVMTDEVSGCRLNTHATYMMMMDVAPAYADLELEKWGCTYVTPQPAVSILLKDGRSLSLYNDVEKSVESITRFSKKDAEIYRKVYLEFKEMCDECLVPQTYRPASPPLELLTMLNDKPLGRKILEISEKSPREIIEECGFETEPLKALLLYLTSMWGIHPDSTGVGYLVPLYVYRMLNSSLIRGGSHRLPSAILKSFIANDGEIIETIDVENVLIENKKAVGIRTTNGLEFRAKAILSTVDPEQSFLRFIGEKELNELSTGMVDAAKGWQWEEVSHFSLHLVTKTEPVFHAESNDPSSGQALIQVMGVESVEEVVAKYNLAKEGGLPHWGHVTTITRHDRSQSPTVVAKYLPEWQAAGIRLHVVRLEAIVPYSLKSGDWEKEKDRYSVDMRDLLNEYAPNMANAVAVRNFPYPPTYIEMKFPNMKKGSIKHGEYQSTQMGYFRPNDLCSQYKTPIEGYYLGGASVFPGGMVLLGSGYGAANVIAKDLGVKPSWGTPKYIEEAIKKRYVP